MRPGAAVADLPNFDALRTYIDHTFDQEQPLTPVRTWIDRLEEWSKARLRELEKTAKELERLRQGAESYERMLLEIEDAKDDYDELVEALYDFERGVRDWREIHDLLPNLLGIHNEKG